MIEMTTRQADQITREFEGEADELIGHYPVSKRSYDVKEKFCEAVGLDPHAEHHGFGVAPPTTADGKFSVEFVECLASCGSAPVALIGDELVENIKPADVSTLVKNLK